MYPHLAVAAALIVSPPRDITREAGESYDRGAYLEAAAVASEGYVSPAEPTAKRLENARMAQEAFAKAYEETAAKGEPHPDYLCRALDVLEATACLAVDEEDVALHKTLAEAHTEVLASKHPGHVCEVGTELRPIRTIPRPRVQASVSPVSPALGPEPLPINTAVDRENRAPAALKISGAVVMSLGVAALATMVGGLAIRSRANRAAIPFADAKAQQDGLFTVEQGREFAGLTAITNAGRQMAFAGGISGALLLVLGGTLVGWSYTSAARARISPMAGFWPCGAFRGRTVLNEDPNEASRTGSSRTPSGRLPGPGR